MKQLFPGSEDKTQPHFSLKEMRAIPPYKGPKRALVELMDEVERKVHHFRKECWNITIELLADHLGLMTNPLKYSLPNVKWAGPISKPSYPGFQQLKEQISTNLIEAYITEAKAKPWDYLGEIFIEEELAGRHNRLGQLLTPKQIVDFMIECTGIGKIKENAFERPDARTEAWLGIEAMAYELDLSKISTNLLLEQQHLRRILGVEPVWEKYTVKPQTVLDPCTGTGRFLIESTILKPKAPLILFGIEIDPSLYRACLVNMAMFSNHPYSIVCGDTLMIDTPYCGPGSKLWDHGNQWSPPDISMFYYKPKPPFKFSLAELAKSIRQQPPTDTKQIRVTMSQAPMAFSLAEYAKTKKQKT
jgi:hypothetical protein